MGIVKNGLYEFIIVQFSVNRCKINALPHYVIDKI